MKNFILYHDNCLDGFMAGMLAFEQAKLDGIENLVVMPINYSDVPPEATAGDSMTIVDFSFKADVVQGLLDKGVRVTIADHHETAIDNLQTLKHCACQTTQKLFSNIIERPEEQLSLFLSDNREKVKAEKAAGCMVVFNNISESVEVAINEKYFPGYPSTARLAVKMLLSLTNTHDLWLHDGDLSHVASKLAAWFKNWSKKQENQRKLLKELTPLSVDIFENLIKDFFKTTTLTKLVNGFSIITKEEAESTKLCQGQKHIRFVLDGDPLIDWVGKVALIDEDVSYSYSYVGSKLVKQFKNDVAVMFVKESEAGTIYSMRSDQNGSNVDVSAIASKLVEMGLAVTGGGHRNAAGMVIKPGVKFYDIV